MSPLVLGIDTSGSWCSVALTRGAAVHARRIEVGNGHSEVLLSMVEAVLAEAGVPLAACDALAFGAGPGSFTGLRITCAAAQGLAFGAGLRVAPIGTLDAIAHAAIVDAPGSRSVLVAQDARMGEVYWRRFERAAGRLAAVSPPALATPMQLRDVLRDGGVALPLDLGCGNAWAVHREVLDGLVTRVVARDAAEAIDVAALGVEAFHAGRLVTADQAIPVYVRNDVARTTIEREASRRATASAP